MSLFAFKKKLQQLGHFNTDYDNIERLNRQFRDQIERVFREAAGVGTSELRP